MSEREERLGVGASVPDPALVNEAPAGLHPSGFDPSRVAWLHIRGQFSYHSEASIIATESGLIGLREAIDEAIATGNGEAVVFSSDGEGYGLKVRRASLVAELGDPPYLEDLAREILEVERRFMRRFNSEYRDFWLEKRNQSVRDSDRSGEADETGTGSAEGESAGLQGIAQTTDISQEPTS